MHILSTASAIVVLLCITYVQSQVPFLGRCPKVSVQQNFEPKRYLGLWFEYKKYFAIFEAGGTCITASYSDEGNGIIGISNKQYSTMLKRYISIMGNAVSRSDSGEAKLSVSFPSTFKHPFSGDMNSNYWVLSTDYTNYSVVWACTDLLFFNLQFAWVLTRDPRPDQTIVNNTEIVLSSNGLSTHHLLLTDHRNCHK